MPLWLFPTRVGPHQIKARGCVHLPHIYSIPAKNEVYRGGGRVKPFVPFLCRPILHCIGPRVSRAKQQWNPAGTAGRENTTAPQVLCIRTGTCVPPCRWPLPEHICLYVCHYRKFFPLSCETIPTQIFCIPTSPLVRCVPQRHADRPSLRPFYERHHIFQSFVAVKTGKANPSSIEPPGLIIGSKFQGSWGGGRLYFWGLR